MSSQTDVQPRTTTKQIQFVQNDIEFIVDVTYTHDNKLPRTWDANVLIPDGMETINCYRTGLIAWMSTIKTYVLEHDNSNVDQDCEKNIHDDIVARVTHNYFNRDSIQKYKTIIKEHHQKIDEKYKGELAILLEEKRVANQSYKAGEISHSKYQDAIDAETDLKNKVENLKREYSSKYFNCGYSGFHFECGNLKDIYCGS
ncbi:hypothetical protein GCM10009133_13590 [Cocleimonas flava]|uniref:Uncharacterized protein n=1 Tax=Cocleimonas flava TaxID=634765 RepID=A0A4R1F0J1_9GAMM|nr:hypothetical protein [Cocleimonas flava]TCJ87726.1 hypothetical protein EV695_2241 [Cocleimonas flava]